VLEKAGRVAALLKNAKHACVFSGAGISTAAGIGDFRGKTGKWTQDDTGVAAGEEEDEGIDYEGLRPTYTHEALARLVEAGQLAHVISQNADGLHRLSGIPADRLSELHGNVFHEKCASCQTVFERPFYTMDDDNQASDCPGCGLSHRTGRLCPACGGPLMDTIINFSDLLEPAIELKAMDRARHCDLMISMGSTMTVTPASDMVTMSTDPAFALVIVNRQPTEFDQKAAVRVFGDADHLMRLVMQGLVPAAELAAWEAGRPARLVAYDKQRSRVAVVQASKAKKKKEKKTTTTTKKTAKKNPKKPSSS
jgi:mono-ADP-ribosyltransferase sirtuin 6